MNPGAAYELESIKRELQSMINELKDISYGLRRDFVGIGTDRCAQSVDLVIRKYEEALRRLKNLDTKTVREEYCSN